MEHENLNTTQNTPLQQTAVSVSVCECCGHEIFLSKPKCEWCGKSWLHEKQTDR
jgi:hypothetical protein